MIFPQETLSTSSASWAHSKKCITRTIDNFVLMLEMSSTDFESQMKKVGAKVSVGQDYCIKAAEQFGSGSTIDSPAFIFVKCDKFLSVDWYGPKNGTSVFNNIMDNLKDHYLDTRDGMRYYGLKYGDQDYIFRFQRVQEEGVMFEFMKVCDVS